jgi:nitronate monooxygenase
MQTSFCADFGIDYPMIQAPIGSATCLSLAAAVSGAGGLGHLAVTWRPPERTHEMVSETRERTNNPFAVNLVVDV